MTDIQIKYWTYVEGARHNVATEMQQKGELGESIRHNLTTESQGQQSINENIRHNKVTENIGYLGAQASLMQASAALENSATNARNAEINQQLANYTGMKTMSDVSVNLSKIALNRATTAEKNIANYIASYGTDIKAVNSLYGDVANTMLTFTKGGSNVTNSAFSAIGGAFKVLN